MRDKSEERRAGFWSLQQQTQLAQGMFSLAALTMNPPIIATLALSGFSWHGACDKQCSLGLCTDASKIVFVLLLRVAGFRCDRTSFSDTNVVELLTLLWLAEATMPVFSIFCNPFAALVTSNVSLRPQPRRRNPNSDSIGSLENLRVSTNLNYFSFNR